MAIKIANYRFPQGLGVIQSSAPEIYLGYYTMGRGLDAAGMPV